MTRPLPRRLLALALASALTGPAWAQAADPFALPAAPGPAAAPAPVAPDAFTVSDIRVEGLQRISAGTVFTYLPVERGDTLDASRAAESVRALYQTGFFEDVRLDRQGDILVVTVVERPAINTLTLTGNKDIKTEDLLEGLKNIGLAEGDTFDRLSLDRVTQELNRQYNNRGKYNVEIKPSVTRLDRNRVDVEITIKEGKAARIQHINLIGNEAFTDDEITDRWESAEHNWLSWYRRDAQYSREKLSGDLEKLNDFYLDRGYIDFNVESTQVAISPDKRDVFVTAGLSEGDVYTVSDVKVTGDTIVPQEEIERLVRIEAGQVFSRQRLEYTSDAIAARLANIGYAFARVNAIPQMDAEKDTVALELRVVPGPRVNVRRIVFKGNARTADEVMRREMRQFEGAWYSQAAIDRSKIRLQRLGYFETVEVETPAVPGTDDQVDVVYTVKETNSGSFVFGIGYSQLSGVNTSLQLSENNFMGSGNRVSVAAQRSVYQRRFDFSFTNPYFTDEGLSLGYNVWWREFDYSRFGGARYSSNSGAAQMFLGLPITENDTVSAMLGIDTNEILTSPFSTPQRIIDYVDAVGNRTFHAWRTQVAYARDTRNDYFMPTRGTYQRIGLEVAMPGSTVEYWKLDYEFSRYWFVMPSLILETSVDLGYGDSYGDPITRTVVGPRGACNAATCETVLVADGLPFFENFYAGGISSAGRVRGFADNTLGPVDMSYGFPQPIGGSLKTVGTIEAIFPTVFDSPAARVSAFIDFGNVYADIDDFDAGTLRASAGVALLWRSPMGPISISYAYPAKTEDTDQIERLQFTFGGAF